MSDEKLKSKLKEVYVRALRLELDPVKVPEHNLINELGIDSISSLEILVWIENEFNVRIEDEDLSPSLIDSLDTISNYLAPRIEQ